MSKKITLSDIRIYPVKSLSGILLNDAEVQPQGIKGDRLMMLVDDNGLFVTQRKYPQLALISTTVSEQSLLIKAPRSSDLWINESDFILQTTPVKIWKDDCVGFVANQAINKWFSEYLEFPVRLVKYNQAVPRRIDPAYSKPADSVSFADGFPLLVISQASLDDLNSRLDEKVTMTNFRPNIVVMGCEAYAEDNWKKIKIGEVEFDAVKTCSRCVMTTVNPNTGIKNVNSQPLKTLSQYRKKEKGVFFGMNLIPRTKDIIHINDVVEVVA